MNIAISYDFMPKIGGAHLWLYEVYRRWPSEVRVLTERHAENLKEAERQREFDRLDHGALRIFRTAAIRQINLIDPRCLSAFIEQARQIGQLSAGDVTCLHALRAFPEGFAGLLYRKTHPRSSRLITYAHGEEVLIAHTSLQLKWMARAVYSASDLVIANSESTRRIVSALCPSAKIVCIHPGVEAGAYVLPEPDVQAYRRAWGWPVETAVVCTVARMEPRKNHAMLIEAVAQLRKDGLPIAYICGGEGQERSRLAARVHALGLQSWVRFPGAVTDREKKLIYAASDIHAMPSVQVGEMIEGFGIVFLEAAAAGVPSIGGNTGGQAEAVCDGRTGFVVDGSSLPDVCRALRTLTLDPALRVRIGQEGRQWAAAHDWTNVVRLTRAEIERLLR